MKLYLIKSNNLLLLLLLSYTKIKKNKLLILRKINIILK
jgi:hypothetical protein